MKLTNIIWLFIPVKNTSLYNAFFKFSSTDFKPYSNLGRRITLREIEAFIGPKKYAEWLKNQENEIVVSRQTNP